ncbi:hypothetical protein LTR08_000493 [Meristemomyces frigidus]|nr:hypothetical protein LTR08_000493 [Meristemomyces frigidus]
MTYHTKAAQSFAAHEQRLESRLAQLEATAKGKGSVSPSKHSSSPHHANSTVAAELDAEFNTFGAMFNSVEERSAGLEKKFDSLDGLEARRIAFIEERASEKASEPLDLLAGLEARLMSAIEERIRPYEQFDKDARNAAQQLFDGCMRSASIAKETHSDTAKTVNEHEASIRDFSGRLLQLEDQSELANAQTLSTMDLAKALMQRLKRGDVLDQATSRGLRLSMDGASDGAGAEPMSARTRMLETPLTDEAGARGSTVEHSVEPVEEDEDEQPLKRRRLGRASRTALRIESDAKDDASAENAAATPRNIADLDTEMEEVVIPAEVRRTSRKPMPTKHSEDMIHWKVANSRMRGLRTSA